MWEECLQPGQPDGTYSKAHRWREERHSWESRELVIIVGSRESPVSCPNQSHFVPRPGREDNQKKKSQLALKIQEQV